jgi:pimeloyl-ACP methyl ester carboxylesterase
VLYEGGPKPRELVLIPEEFIVRLERFTGAGEREQAVMTFMLNAAGVAPEELEALRSSPFCSARMAAAHTSPREPRALNDYGPDADRLAAIQAPVLLVVGEQTDPRRRHLFEQSVRVFNDNRIAVLSGQRHAAHQTGRETLAAALGEFVRDWQRSLPNRPFQRLNNVNRYCEIAVAANHWWWSTARGVTTINWAPVVPLLGQSFRVVTFDRRGHSQSESPPGQGSFAEDADDLGGLIGQLHLGPAHVAGNSGAAANAFAIGCHRSGSVG